MNPSAGLRTRYLLLTPSPQTQQKASAKTTVQPLCQHAFEGHIEQKNFALSQAKHDYILSLDADEALSPELEASIAAIKKDWKHDGHECNRLTCYCGQWIRHSGWYPDRKSAFV